MTVAELIAALQKMPQEAVVMVDSPHRDEASVVMTTDYYGETRVLVQ